MPRRSRGSIVNRGPKRWAIVIELDRDGSTRRRQKWHAVKGTRLDAERERTRLLHQIDNSTYAEPTKMTVGAWLDRWLADHARPTVGARTLDGYTMIVEKYLKPRLGALVLAKLRPAHIAAYHGAMLADGRRRRPKGHAGPLGLSARSVLHHHRVLGEALRRAVKLQLLAVNPCDAVDPPRPVMVEAKVLDGAGMAALLAAAEGMRLHVPILAALLTGLRRGELLGLAWSDVDLDRGTLRVRRSLQQVLGEPPFFKPPKTDRGRRAVHLPVPLVEALRHHEVAQKAERLRLGDVYDNQDLVFPAADGRPWSPVAFTHAFVDLARRPGVPRVRFHDLRHSHATALLIAGIHPKVVSERLGHSTVNITLDLYSHVLPGLDEDAAKRAGDALEAALGKATKGV
jgi:integrase